MKIRQGFVSNSSSSSFCIIGNLVDESEFKELSNALKLNLDFDNDDKWWELVEKLVNELQNIGFDAYEGECCVLFGHNVKMDTPISDQIKETEKEFNELGIPWKPMFDYGEICTG